MSQRISKQYHNDAYTAFALLAFSARPISLGGAAEALAINLDEGIFDKRDRLRDSRDVFKICSSFVDLSPFTRKIRPWEPTTLALKDEDKEFRFAHYSVKEYLISERATILRVESQKANALLARLCLTYLLSINRRLAPEGEALRSLPFLLYASSYWHVHTKHCSGDNNSELACRLFDTKNERQLHNSLTMWNP